MPEIDVNYLLFDLDGTLVNSTAAVEKTWQDTINAHNAAYPDSPIVLEEFLHQSHGSRSQELMKTWFPYRGVEKKDIDAFEAGIVSNYGLLAKEVTGATTLLTALTEKHKSSWAIVTSGTTSLATGWISTLFGDSRQPPVFVTADSVEKGKPDPEGYRKAFNQLRELNGDVGASTAVVFEDAPTGIAAGVAAGFPVIGITTTFPKEKLLAAGASYVIEDLTSLNLSKKGDSIVISF